MPPDTVRVLIATTQGPVEIEAIIDLDPGEISIVALGSSADVVAGLMTPYGNFVAKGSGVIARSFGHDAFRLELSSEIHAGDSWQLAVFIAHALHRRGRLAEAGQPAPFLVWATGQVDYRLRVAEIGHVPEKLAMSMGRFAAERAKGTTIHVIWPKANREDAGAAAWERLVALDVTIHAADDAGEVLAALGIDSVPPKVLAAAKSPPALPSRRLVAWMCASIAEVLVILAFGPIAPPWPPGIVTGTIALALLTLAANSPLLRRSRATAGVIVPRLATAMTGALFALYIACISLFEYQEPSTGAVFVGGLICTHEAALVYKASCPWLRLDQVSEAGYAAAQLWTTSSITVVQTGLTALWLAVFLSLSVIVGHLAMAWISSSESNGRSGEAG